MIMSKPIDSELDEIRQNLNSFLEPEHLEYVMKLITTSNVEARKEALNLTEYDGKYDLLETRQARQLIKYHQKAVKDLQTALTHKNRTTY